MISSIMRNDFTDYADNADLIGDLADEGNHRYWQMKQIFFCEIITNHY
jgi:hypothetical protein